MRITIIVSALCLLTLPASAQSFPRLSEVANFWPGPPPVGSLGDYQISIASTSGVPDMTGDGIDDIIVEWLHVEYGFGGFPTSYLRSDLHSGDGAGFVRLLTWRQTSLALPRTTLDDLTGDGVPEQAWIGYQPWTGFSSINAGDPMTLEVLDGTDSSVLWQRALPYVSSRHGSVRSISDLNGDGFGELLVLSFNSVAPNSPPLGSPSLATIYWLDGATGQTLWQIIDGGNDIEWVHPVPDLDGDGVEDYLVGAPGSDWIAPNAGSVGVISGATFQYFRFWHGADPGERFGRVGVPAGDRDGDGIGDLLIESESPRRLALFSGATGVRITTVPTSDPRLELVEAPRHDIDGDGVADLRLVAQPIFPTVAQPNPPAPFQQFISGVSLHPLLDISAVGAIAGDLNGDGSPELVDVELVSTPAPSGGVQSSLTFSITSLRGAHVVGHPGAALGLAWQHWSSQPATGRVNLSGGAPHEPALIAASFARAPSGALVSGSGLPLLISDATEDLFLLQPLILDATGSAEFPLDLGQASIAGELVHLQWAATGPAPSVSNRLELLFGP